MYVCALPGPDGTCDQWAQISLFFLSRPEFLAISAGILTLFIAAYSVRIIRRLLGG